MTRQITAYGKEFNTKQTSTHPRITPHAAKINTGKSRTKHVLENVSKLYTSAVRKKRMISEGFVALTEALADKTAREGLFGEDKDKNYCGTSVGYISE